MRKDGFLHIEVHSLAEGRVLYRRQVRTINLWEYRALQNSVSHWYRFDPTGTRLFVWGDELDTLQILEATTGREILRLHLAARRISNVLIGERDLQAKLAAMDDNHIRNATFSRPHGHVMVLRIGGRTIRLDATPVIPKE